MTARTDAWWTGALAPAGWSAWLPLPTQGIRIEAYLDGDRHVVRAELPGIDPAKDVHITYLDGTLRLQVERTREHRDKVCSEFHYGSFTRTIELPRGVREDDIAATYTDGILQVTVKVGEPEQAAKRVPVTVTDGK